MAMTSFERLQPYLEPDETLLWCGKPLRRESIRSDAPGLIILLPVSALIIFKSAANGYEVPGPVGIIFVALTGYLIVSIFYRANCWRWTAYGVTDRRLLFTESLRKREPRVVPVISAANLQVRVGPNGIGTISCARRSMPWRKQITRRGNPTPALFRHIADARHVYDLVMEAQQRRRDILAPRERVGAP